MKIALPLFTGIFISLSSWALDWGPFDPFFVTYRIENGSLATREQLIALGRIIYEDMDETRVVLGYDKINQALQRMGLPLINSQSTALRAELRRRSGFSGTILAGVTIDDGVHRYCLPCVTEGQFVIGINPSKLRWWNWRSW